MPTTSPSSWQQCKLLLKKNRLLASRNKTMLWAEYLIMPLYVILWMNLIVWVFPDDRLSLADLEILVDELNTAVPSACTFFPQVAYFPQGDESARDHMGNLGVQVSERSIAERLISRNGCIHNGYIHYKH